MKDLRNALWPLLTTAIAVGLAWGYYENTGLGAALGIVALMVTITALASFDIGRANLPDHPVRAVKFMNAHRVGRVAGGGIGAALVIVLTVELAADTLKGADKQLVSTLATAATAFVTALFGTWSGEDAADRFAGRVRDSFQANYKRRRVEGGSEEPGVRYFDEGSRGELLVYSENAPGGISGWSDEARMKRAKGIAEELVATPPTAKRERKG